MNNFTLFKIFPYNREQFSYYENNSFIRKIILENFIGYTVDIKDNYDILNQESIEIKEKENNSVSILIEIYASYSISFYLYGHDNIYRKNSFFLFNQNKDEIISNLQKEVSEIKNFFKNKNP